MEERRPSNTNFAASLLFFGLAATTAFVLLLTALVMWLAWLTGSLMASVLIVGVFFGLLSVIIYRLALRDALDHIRDQIETVYDVARIARSGYEWVSDKVALFMNLRGK